MLCELGPCVVNTARVNKEVIHIRLTPEILQQLTTSRGSELSVSFDGTPGLRIGQTLHPFSLSRESCTNEVYRCSESGSPKSLERIGKITSKAALKRELGGSISEQLKSRQAEEAAAKQDRRVQALELSAGANKRARSFVPVKDSPVPLRTASPARRSPFLQPRKSPALVATTAKPPIPPLRTRLLQMLAMGSLTERELTQRLNVPSDHIRPSLSELAIMTGGEWSLKDEAFHEVKLWDWKGYTSAERAAVISRAGEAMDRMTLPSRHPSRARLIHPEKRDLHDRGDTSPLSLGDTICTNRNSDGPQDGKTTSPLKSVYNNDDHEAVETETVLEKKKITAKGLMSTGSQTTAKKAKLGLPSVSNGQSKPRPESKDSSPGQIPTESSRLPAADQDASQHKEPGATGKRLSPLTNVKRVDGLTSSDATANRHMASYPRSEQEFDKRDTGNRETRCQSPTRSNEPPRRLQTPTVIHAQAAPARGSLDSAEDDIVVDRTSSITSSTTERSDRSQLSAASSATTAPSPTSAAPHPEKRRSKLLTLKKPAARPVSNAASRAASRTSSPAPKAVLMASTETGTSPLSSPKKRKAEPEETTLVESKRLLTDDLQRMNMDCNRMYTEYKVLHDKFCTEIGDSALFDKFLDMHTKISNWRNTFMAGDGHS